MEIDDFAYSLLETSKRYLELSGECHDATGKNSHLQAALLLAFCSLEANLNSICDEFAASDTLAVHEQGVLQEREVRLIDGRFEMTNNLRMSKLEDRIELLHRHFTGNPIDHTASWWSDLKSGIRLRNALTHPKDAPTLSHDSVSRAVAAVVDTLDATFVAVYRRHLPQANRRLQSRFTFK